ncbi:LPS export ABC transporter periplasmic protein LptC [Phreatobacter stygius]|uniref:LPS export ABC transporter periplasmic protein LptC n=1 Tax=Phreatobacter stygius TaxID=1940610 RepID=A0A4D7AXX0_9HYPH|nr:LPS export ABC transporter periplasmic protein LptC [Phreatobacter stygius]QCI65031.1 LPS export ABC transporter periplasmic protein LptC [Phreatobacter stygius]
MAARPIDDFGGAAGGAFGVAAREQAFQAAFRHSRQVRRLRVAVPLAASLIVVVVSFVSWWDPLRMLNLPVSIGALSLSGSKVTMEAPRLTGYTNDNRFYRVTAIRAEHDIAHSNVVGLSAIDAEMELEGGGTARVVSSSGVLDTKSGIVELTSAVSVTTSNGQAGQVTSAVVDTRTGTITAKGPVNLESPRGQIAGDRMEIRENGKVILLEGAVRGNFMPEPPDPSVTDLNTDTPSPPAAPRNDPAPR